MKRSLVALALTAAVVWGGAASAYAAPDLVATDDKEYLYEVTAASPMTQDCFGADVALSNETLVVSADGMGGSNRGEAAYVFTRSPEGWTQEQRIALSSAEDAQPRCVAIDGDTLAVALQGDVQVWVRLGWTWRLQAQLTGTGAGLVGSIGIEGDTLVAGAPTSAPDSEGNGDSDAGAVYVFQRDGENWSLTATLQGDPTQKHGYFGNSVDLQGDMLAVGAPLENAPVRRAGAVYVFHRAGSSWPMESRLVVSGAEEFASFGGNVQLDGDQLATSMAGWSSQTGAVYIWDRTGGSWTSSERIVAPDGRPGYPRDYGGDSFGTAMALAGDTLVVGAQEDDDEGSNSGSVYILKKVDGTWVFQRKIVSPLATPGALFGRSLDVDSGRVVVGMPRAIVSGKAAAGSVYAFDLGLVTPIDTTLTISASDLLANDAIPVGAAAVAVEAAPPIHGALETGADGGFMYAPAGQWSGTDQFTYGLQSVGVGSAVARTMTSAAFVESDTATVNIKTWQPTKLGLTSTDTTPRYSGSVTMKARLTTVAGVPLKGRVGFEVLSGTLWKSAGWVETGSSGLASLKATSFTTRRTYRVRTGWSSVLGSAGSPQVNVVPHVSIGVPAMTTGARRGRAFTVTGSIRPRHSTGSKAVELHYYRKEAGSYVPKKTAWAKVARNYSTYSKYSASVSLSQAGRWRLRAYHPAGSTNAATWSSYLYFTVR